MIDYENDKKRTALLEAASYGKINVVIYLLDEKAAITKDGELFSCLDHAILNGDKDSANAMVCHDRWDEVPTNFIFLSAKDHLLRNPIGALSINELFKKHIFAFFQLFFPVLFVNFRRMLILQGLF